MKTAQIAGEIIKAFEGGNKLMIIGNGGSAAESQHMAAELVGKYEKERKALPALALTTDTAVLTAIANDFGYANVFERQIQALGKPGDILLILTTSGKSKNCIKAKERAEKMGMKVFELPRDGTRASYIQEMHLVDIHEICRDIEEAFI